MLRGRIQRHQGLPPSPIIEIMNQLQKGTAMIRRSQTLLAAQVLQLEALDRAASEHKSRNRKRIQGGGDLLKDR
jgi:hypothetical protein